LDENIRNKRKGVTKSIFQMEIETINNSPSEKRSERWIIITDSQQNPTNLSKYAKQHRLRVSGGVAALLKSSTGNESNFIGRIYSFFQSSEATHLPVHLNGTWAQGSDRGRLLIEEDDLPDLDHQKLEWNRHILLNFLPGLYCELLKEIVELRDSKKIELNDHPIIKFWPFPPPTRNYPTYVIEYGFNVLQHILDDDFWLTDDYGDEDEIMVDVDDDENEVNHVDSLFKILPRKQLLELRNLIRNNWDEIGDY
jgi:hypothetical protein